MAGLPSTLLGMLPDPNPRLLAFTGGSSALLVAYYYAVRLGLKVRGKEQTERQNSWVLTLCSSAIMTLASLPYLWHWLKTGQVDTLEVLADYCSCFFVAYLVTDLVIGSIHYRSSISLLTGWIHHIAYILLLSIVVIPHAYSSLFALCCILELPTFLLAAGSLDARFRNDYVFAAVFFATRIVLHIYIGTQYALRALSPAGGSWTAPLVLAAALPMHVLWMHACAAGILRRRARLHLQQQQQHLQQQQQQMAQGARMRNLPAYLLSRPLVSSALAHVRARRVPGGALLRRSRQHVLRLLHDALRDAEAAAAHPAAHAPALEPHAAARADAASGEMVHPPWRSIRRRVAGRIRRSLPEYDGVVQGGVVEVVPEGIAVQ